MPPPSGELGLNGRPRPWRRWSHAGWPWPGARSHWRAGCRAPDSADDCIPSGRCWDRRCCGRWVPRANRRQGGSTPRCAGATSPALGELHDLVTAVVEVGRRSGPPGPASAADLVRTDAVARSVQRGSVRSGSSSTAPPGPTTSARTDLSPHQLVHFQVTERTPLPAVPSGRSPSRVPAAPLLRTCSRGGCRCPVRWGSATAQSPGSRRPCPPAAGRAQSRSGRPRSRLAARGDRRGGQRACARRLVVGNPVDLGDLLVRARIATETVSRCTSRPRWIGPRCETLATAGSFRMLAPPAHRG
jgi:hypothetical protein